MRNLIAGAIILFCSVPLQASGADSSVEKVAETAEAPETCSGVVEKIYGKLDAGSIKTLRDTKREDLIKFHLTWGMGIRNSNGLWTKDSKIRRSCAQSLGKDDMDPESASTVIMEMVWDRVHSGI